MADESPNPYSAPAAALSDGAPDPKQPRPKKPSRLAAVVVSLCCYPLPGPGFFLLGRRRRFVVWTVVGLLTWAVLAVAVWMPFGRLATILLLAMFALWLSSVVATAITNPSGPPLRRALPTALLLIAAAQGTSFAVKRWLYDGSRIPSGSMVPTLLVGDAILFKKGRSGITRGDVIVFEFPSDRSTIYVKRVVALGGDTVEVRNGVVSINGVELEQTPIEGICPAEDRPGLENEPTSCKLARESNGGRTYPIMFDYGRPASDEPRIRVPANTVFVLGDNRDNSYDSRRWGALPLDHIKGKATVIYLSNDPKTGPRWSRIGQAIE